VSEHKYSPARVQEEKNKFNRKIARDLDKYYQLGDDIQYSYLEPKKQTILQMLTLKYNIMSENKQLMQGNDYFLIMAKYLLTKSQPACRL